MVDLIWMSHSNICDGIKIFTCYITIHQFIKSVYFASIMFIYLGNFAIFHAKMALGYFAKGILQNFAYFPTKFMFHVKCTSILYYVGVLSNHCIKYYACCMFALANYFFCGIFISKCQTLYFMQCLAVLFNNKCVLLQRTLILSEWCFFESNILLFCSQPHIIACIMYFVGVPIYANIQIN